MAVIINGILADSSTLKHLQATILNNVLLNTISLIFWVSICSLTFGVVSAYIVVFYDFAFRNILEWLLVLPFAIPTYIMGYIYADYFGFLGEFHFLLKSFGINSYFDFLSFPSLVLVISLSLYPYIYLFTRNAFLKQSSTLIDASKALNISNTGILLTIILPLARPAIIASLILVIMETLNEYGAVSYFGLNTFSTAILNAWFGLDDLASASYLSSISLLIVFLFLSIEKLSRKKASYNNKSEENIIKAKKINKKQSALCIIILSIIVFFGFIFPFLQILKGTMENINLIDEEYIETILNSFFYAGFFAIIISTIAIFAVYTVRIFPTKKLSLLLRISTLGYSIPGAVISIGVIALLSQIDKIINYFDLSFFLLGSYIALFMGLLVRFLILGVNNIESGFEKIGIDVNMASRNLGYSYISTFWYIDFKLVRYSFIVSFLLVFVDILKELPITLILRPFNYETLSTKTYYLANNDSLEQSYVYGLSIILLSFIPMFLTIRLSK